MSVNKGIGASSETMSSVELGNRVGTVLNVSSASQIFNIARKSRFSVVLNISILSGLWSGIIE